MQFIHTFLARFHAWRQERAIRRSIVPLFTAKAPPLTIHRDVSRQGVRVFCLCGGCGARLETSATLCDECAQGRSRSMPGF